MNPDRLIRWQPLRRILLFFVGALIFSSSASAQQTGPFRQGVTTLVMGVDVATGIVAAAPGSRIRVPHYEQVTLAMPADWPYPMQWCKDGKVIAGATGRTLVIPLATSVDSGRYTVTGSPWPVITTGIALTVVAEGHLGNFSTRIDLQPNAPPQIVGFAVEGRTAKILLIRVVGPSLRQFGLDRTAARPRFTLFDSAGKAMVFPAHPITVDWPRLFESVGAFSLLPNESDAYDYYTLPPGTYTVHMNDETRVGGAVLFETYELPPESLLPAVPAQVIPNSP